MTQEYNHWRTKAIGVDWITCTTTARESSEALWAVALQLLPRHLEKGEDPTRWHGHGYDGLQAGGLCFGSRTDGVLVRLSGQQARDEWRAPCGAADNVTRLDLALDLESDVPKTAMARDLYRDSFHSHPRNGRPPIRSLVTSSDHGSTCYVGKRSSENFGRLYDKGVQQKTHAPGLWWRWEVELKGDTAAGTAAGLLQAPSEACSIADTTVDWFTARGGRVPRAEGILAIRNWGRDPTKTDKRIQWLARSVRPTAVKLLDVLGRERVLTALGMSQFIDTSP
jgi:hypothetical protein